MTCEFRQVNNLSTNLMAKERVVKEHEKSYIWDIEVSKIER